MLRKVGYALLTIFVIVTHPIISIIATIKAWKKYSMDQHK